MSYTRQQQTEAREWLLRYLKPGMTVYTILRHVTKSGMTRSVSLIITTDDGPLDLDAFACRLLEGFDDRHGGCKISGCGTDAGFLAVYNIAAQLWPEGFGCTGEHCQSNDHSNGDRDYTPHNAALVEELHTAEVAADIAANHWHEAGGYALRQQWM